jgi:hypothetical protein
MKNILLLCVLFLLSCNNESVETVTEGIAEADSILEISQKHFDTSVIVGHQSDSITREKVIKVLTQIKFLSQEVNKYNNISKNEFFATEKIIYKIDTVYIETKKNFWGKEKTNTVVKSDSSITEKTDTITKQVIVDSLSNGN